MKQKMAKIKKKEMKQENQKELNLKEMEDSKKRNPVEDVADMLQNEIYPFLSTQFNLRAKN